MALFVSATLPKNVIAEGSNERLRVEFSKLKIRRDSPYPWRYLVKWQTNIMPAPAFWYYQTKKEAKKAFDGLLNR